MGALGHLLGLSWEGLGPLLCTLGASWAASWPPWAAQDAAKKRKKIAAVRFWAVLGASWALLVSFGPLWASSWGLQECILASPRPSPDGFEETLHRLVPTIKQ